MKRLSVLFAAVAILLSDIMCAAIAYGYCDLLWGGQYAGYSASPSTAVVYAIPFVIGIIISVVLALVFRKKAAT